MRKGAESVVELGAMPGVRTVAVLSGLHQLTDADVAAFLARADGLGHDSARLLAGGVVETFVPVPTLEQLRGLCQASHGERRARQAVFFHPAIMLRGRLGQGVHDRCEAFVFADGTAGEADRAGLARHLPFAARQVSMLHRRVAAGEVWDLTVPPESLGLDDRDDLFNVVNVGELVIEPGGRVIVQGNLLMFGCQHLVHTGLGGGEDYQFGPEGADGVALMHRLIRHVVGTGEISDQDHGKSSPRRCRSPCTSYPTRCGRATPQPADGPVRNRAMPRRQERRRRCK